MTNTDFFDDDLVQHRDSVKRVKMGPGDERGAPEATETEADVLADRAVSDFNLTRMAKHKEEVEGKVAQAMEELERLRQKQEDLEKEKRELADLRRKQDDYEQGKRDIITHLNQSVLTMEKDEIRSQQVTDLLSATRTRFRAMLTEVEHIDEESWEEEAIREELDKALSVIGDARMEYNKSMAKIQAVTGSEPRSAEVQPVLEEPSGSPAQEGSFLDWLKIGTALTLPLIFVLVVLAVLYCVLRSQAYL